MNNSIRSHVELSVFLVAVFLGNSGFLVSFFDYFIKQNSKTKKTRLIFRNIFSWLFANIIFNSPVGLHLLLLIMLPLLNRIELLIQSWVTVYICPSILACMHGSVWQVNLWSKSLYSTIIDLQSKSLELFYWPLD